MSRIRGIIVVLLLSLAGPALLLRTGSSPPPGDAILAPALLLFIVPAFVGLVLVIAFTEGHGKRGTRRPSKVSDDRPTETPDPIARR